MKSTTKGVKDSSFFLSFFFRTMTQAQVIIILWSSATKMNPQSICLLLFLACTLSCFPCLETKPASQQRLLLVLIDGFRFDYLNQTGIPLPGFDKIARQGVKAGGFVPDFPSLSYPNYYTIMTGMLYTQHHCLVYHLLSHLCLPSHSVCVCFFNSLDTLFWVCWCVSHFEMLLTTTANWTSAKRCAHSHLNFFNLTQHF